MILKSIRFTEYVNRPEVWYLEKFLVEKINLIVGKNASGKTRTLNVISNLSNLVSGYRKLSFQSGDFQLTFKKNNKITKYILKYEDAKITKEQLIVNGKRVLNRGKGGRGFIYAAQLDKEMKFQTPENELACVARRDSVQHPFFEELYQWGKASRHFYFGGKMGQDFYAVLKKSPQEEPLDYKATDLVVSFLKKGIEKYGSKLVKAIKEDMGSIGYRIDDIGLTPIPGIRIQADVVSDVLGIYAKEVDLKGRVNQLSMSQGMFRALSLIIQLNLSILAGPPSCIFIDDIAEGLDYERSTNLIKLLMKKAEDSPFQLIMATNDRFVMNSVPLEYWSVIQRSGQKCKLFNHQNAKKIFNEFKFTGLNNFDFFATDFYTKGLKRE